jgi:hypothetical protein
MSTDADLGVLQSLAGKLHSGSDSAESLANAPDAPEAGPCSGAIAAVMSGYADSMGALVETLDGAANAVAEGKDLYHDTESANRDSLGGGQH